MIQSMKQMSSLSAIFNMEKMKNYQAMASQAITGFVVDGLLLATLVFLKKQCVEMLNKFRAKKFIRKLVNFSN